MFPSKKVLKVPSGESSTRELHMLSKDGLKNFAPNVMPVLSENGLKEKSRLSNMQNDQRAREYANLPPLPMNQEIEILRMSMQSNIEYKHFRAINPSEYPKCVNPSLDYEDDECVAPISIITTDGKTYKVSQMLWFPLCDALNTICIRQQTLQKKLLPFKVFIDDKDQWICEVFNLGNK